MTNLSTIIEQVQVTSDEAEINRLQASAASILIEHWVQSPHIAMEGLEICAISFPYENAVVLVRNVTERWKKMPDYSWSAGGNADHCFLAALLMTRNYDLVDENHYKKCSNSIEYRIGSEGYLNRLRDKKAKLRALKGIQRINDPEVLKALARVNFGDGIYEFVRAIDGDTIVVLPPQELRAWIKDIHVRLYGIETPELWEELGKDYRNHLEDLCAKDGLSQLFIVWERERPGTTYGGFPLTSFGLGDRQEKEEKDYKK